MIKKATRIVLMLCFILSGAFCYANNAFGKGFETDGGSITITLTQSNSGSSSDKSSSINPIINGNPMQQYRYYVTNVLIEGRGDEYTGPIYHWTEIEYARYNYIESGVIEGGEL